MAKDKQEHCQSKGAWYCTFAPKLNSHNELYLPKLQKADCHVGL
jgi:hypothetical protein